jgi:hypothetical protein
MSERFRMLTPPHRIVHDPDVPPTALVLFRIISRRDWDRLQSWHKSCPGSTVEHLEHGLYVLTIPAGGTVAVA